MKSGFKIEHFSIVSNPECIVVYNFESWNKVANVKDRISKKGMLSVGRWKPKNTTR